MSAFIASDRMGPCLSIFAQHALASNFVSSTMLTGTNRSDCQLQHSGNKLIKQWQRGSEGELSLMWCRWITLVCLANVSTQVVFVFLGFFFPSRRPLRVSISGSSFAARRACVSRTTWLPHFTPSEKHFWPSNTGDQNQDLKSRIESRVQKGAGTQDFCNAKKKNGRGRRSKPGRRSGFVRRGET